MTKRFIRVEKKNSAFVYAILESLEGMASFSTVDPPDASVRGARSGKNCRDLEICVPNGFLEDVNAVLSGMAKDFPILDVTEEFTATTRTGGAHGQFHR